MNLSQLVRILPRSRPVAGRYLDWLNITMGEFSVRTNTVSQIRSRTNDAGVHTVRISTLGWFDFRARDN